MKAGLTPAALTVAGSDSSAGAGIQADLKTFSALGVYGATVITAITAQNTLGVHGVHQIPPQIITGQIDAVFSDMNIAAVKIGMLGDEATIEAVAAGLETWASGIPVIVDPVMVSTSGARLLKAQAERLLVARLFPLAVLVTPNLFEAAAVLETGVAEDEAAMRHQAIALHALGARTVLLKGGHGHGPESIDIFYDGAEHLRFASPRLPTKNTHGTGCTLASAIAAFLVKGAGLREAVAQAKTYLHEALLHADSIHVGSGPGPVSHFHKYR